MELGLSLEANLDLDKSGVIHDLSTELDGFFKERIYGESIKMYTMGFILVSAEFEFFFKVRKPRYTKGKKVITHDGISVTVEDSLEYNIKPDYNAFIRADAHEARKILAKSILESLSVLDDMRSKIKDFDIVKFRADLISFFEFKNLL